MSCKEEYYKYIRSSSKGRFLNTLVDEQIEDLYFDKYILPSLLENNQLLLKKISSSDSNNLSRLPNSFCKTIIENYFNKIHNNSI